VNGVGLGRGVSAATTPSGVWSVPVGGMRLGVDVKKGIGVAGREVERIPGEVQEERRKREEDRYRQAVKSERCMRRL
jgi:hypothetical protein